MVTVKFYGKDRYGRVLGVVFIGGMDVNLEMVRSGLAEVYRGRPAKGIDMDAYWIAEDDAKRSVRGMWGLGDKYISPKEWRKMGRD